MNGKRVPQLKELHDALGSHDLVVLQTHREYTSAVLHGCLVLFDTQTGTVPR